MDYDDPEYELLHMIAMDVKPECEVDEDGSLFYYLSDAHRVFLSRKDKIKFPFTYDDYINNIEIIATLKGYGIDIEKFWLAILFIYDVTQEKCVNVLEHGETAKVQTEKLKEFLSGIHSFTITANGKKKLVINDNKLINYLKNHLETLLVEKNYDLESNTFSLNLQNGLYSSSVQMWFAANRFLQLFEALKLPAQRRKNIATEYETDGKKIRIQTVSFNKMLLISQLMYLMKFTKNKSFLVEDNSLKGILKQYKNFKLNTFSKAYFIWCRGSRFWCKLFYLFERGKRRLLPR